MVFQLPSKDALRTLAASLGMDIDDDYAEQALAVLGGSVAAFRLIEQLPDEVLPVRYPRTPGLRPYPQDNPYGAWAVRTDITGAAGGTLDGRRVAIKDNVAIAGVPLMNGSSVLDGYVPDGDATIVTRILDAGGYIAGKAVCEYFCFAGGSVTSASGPVISPRNPGHTTGGSSSGSAALLAAGAVDLAIGGDQAGSIRIPASFTGVVGLKPTFGLVPYTGILGLDYTIDHAGPMARSVADCALFLEVLAGADGIDGRQNGVRTAAYSQGLDRDVSGMRIGVVREGFGLAESHEGSDAAVRSAIKALEGAGALVEEVSIPWHANGLALWSAIANEGHFNTLFHGFGVGHLNLGAYPLSIITALGDITRRANELPHTVKISALLGCYAHAQYQGRYYAKAQNLRRRLRRAYDEMFVRFDLLAMPTLPFPTLKLPPADAPLADVIGHSWSMLANTAPFNLTGHPAISVPCGETEGKPVGLMLIGQHFEDAMVLHGAAACERLMR